MQTGSVNYIDRLNVASIVMWAGSFILSGVESIGIWIGSAIKQQHDCDVVPVVLLTVTWSYIFTCSMPERYRTWFHVQYC